MRTGSIRVTLIALASLVGIGSVSAVATAAPGDLVTTFETGGNEIVGTPLVQGVAVQSDGDVVAVGQTGGDLAVYRYLPNGIRDSSFANGGVFSTTFPCAVSGTSTCGGSGTAIAVQANGDIVAVSLLLSGSQSYGLAMVRLLPDGSLDPSFGSNGIFTDNQYPDAAGGTSMVLASDGSMSVAGWDDTPSSGQRMVVWKVTSSGSLDSSFGTQGEYLGALFPQASANSISWAANGGTVIAGTTVAANSVAKAATVVELTPQGTAVPSFGSAGTVQIYDSQYNGNGADTVVTRPDGSFLVGEWDSLGGVVLHVTSGGALDTTYGSNGYDRALSPRYVSELLAMVIDAEGRLVVTGRTPDQQNAGYQGVIARLNPDGTIDSTFGYQSLDGYDQIENAGSNMAGLAIAMDSKGNLVVGGYNSYYGGFLAEFEGGTLPPNPPFEVAFQASNTGLRFDGPSGLSSGGAMAPGTSPSVIQLIYGGYKMAYHEFNGSLWTSGIGGNTDWNVGMAPGTSPAMVSLPNGGYEIAFQAYGGDLWTIGTAGWTDWKVGMAPGTSPSIVAMPNGGYEIAFQAYGGALWSVGTAGWVDWGVGMAPNTSPSVYAPSNGSYEIAFQSYGGTLWSVGHAGWTNWTVGMASGTSPAAVRLSNGGYQIAFQAYGGALWTIGTAGWTAWNLGMASSTSPALVARPSGGFEVAFQAYGGDLWTIGSAGWTDWPLEMEPSTSPAEA